MIARLASLFYTLQHLRPRQLFYFIVRRQFPSRSVAVDTGGAQRQPLQLLSPIAIRDTRAGESGERAIRFLNQQETIDFDAIDWCPDHTQRLWRYNLHYFDYLRDSAWSADEKQLLIDSWIAANPQNSQPGWEPFTCSLRIVNWIVYLSTQNATCSSAVLDSLYTQALWLEKNDERHILANHYFENLKALLFAGCFFNGSAAADRWRRRAISELKIQLREQTLEDGGHYERSPQYHCLMLENYLDIYNLASNNPAFFDEAFVAQLTGCIEQGLVWLNDIVFPDRMMPLFNDSAFGVAPAVDELVDYAASLKLPCGQSGTVTSNVGIIEKDDSGLYGFKTHTDMVIMDCGEIGPAYQPGHTHCDFLSYELMLAGRRLVVDTGVSEYEPGPRRQYVRSTKAHNTISVDGGEQSEIWGEFRVARRARKHFGRVIEGPECIEISGVYRGFYQGLWDRKGRFEHQRLISVKLVKDAFEAVEVVDTLHGSGEHLIESYIHIHPDFIVVPNPESADGRSLNILLEGRDGQQQARRVFAELNIDDDCDVTVEESIYCPQFGLEHKIDCVVISRRASLPQTLAYRFKTHRFEY